MRLQPEVAHHHLKLLLAQVPPLEGKGHYAEAQREWLGRAAGLVEMIANMHELATFRSAVQSVGNPSNRTSAVNTMMVVLHSLLAQIEFQLPASARGAFIAVRAEFSAFTAVSNVLNEAKSDVVLVDPYLNEKVLSDFAITAPERVSVRLLGDSQASASHGALKVASERWISQYGAARPLSVRLTQPRVLHDRLILVDGTVAWVVTQSFKDLAKRSPASLTRADAELAAAKIHAYEQIWKNASPL